MSPEWARRLHYLAAVFWLLSFPAVLVLGLTESVPLLVFISIYANVASHWSAGMAMRVEVELKDDPSG